MSSLALITAVGVRALDQATRTDQSDVYLPEIGPALSEAQIRKVEVQLRLQLPETLRRVYCEIGDGGFGPGYGFLPMTTPRVKHGDAVVDLYAVFSGKDADDPTWYWPSKLLPIVDFGCAIRACVNCDTSQVVISDPNLHESSWSETYLDQMCVLDEWLARWCAGENLWEQIHVRRAT